MNRNRKKYVTVERAKRRLEHRLSDIDWEEDVLLPDIEKRDAAIGYPDYKLVEIETPVLETPDDPADGS